jgi:hypothetical protein
LHCSVNTCSHVFINGWIKDRIRDSSFFSNKNGNTDGSLDESSKKTIWFDSLLFRPAFQVIEKKLREQLHSSSTSTLKRFMTSSKYFKYRSNDKQFIFNLWTTLNRLPNVLELSEALSKKAFLRNQFIKIADKSVGG